MTSQKARSEHPSTPDIRSRSCRPSIDVQPVDIEGASPPLYRALRLHRAHFQALWRHLSKGRPVDLHSPDAIEASKRILLVLCAPDSGPPLCLSGDTIDGSGLLTEPLPLSWRLAALEFSRRLPSHPTDSTQRSLMTTCSGPPADHPLRIRPRIPAPAHTLATTSELSKVVVALRAHHCSVLELTTRLTVEESRLRAFVAGLYAVQVITEVPPPLTDDSDPFTYLGLHWSAHPSLIRCTYGRLRRRLKNSSGSHSEQPQLLECAFDLLRHRQDRRRLRHSLVPPPVIGEVLTYLREELQRTLHDRQPDRAIGLCRRITELDPSDQKTETTLHNLLTTHP